MPFDSISAGFGIRENDDVGTPDLLLQHFKEKYRLDFDPCPLGGLLGGEDGLHSDWGDRSFVNPPYSRTANWVKKAVYESQLGKFVCLLIPWRSNSSYWQKFVLPHASEIHLLNKITFKGYKRMCPMPMAVVIFDGIKGSKRRKRTIVKDSHLKKNYFAYYTLT
jgi:hypothetical protein